MLLRGSIRSHVWNVNPFWYGHLAIGGRAIACEENKVKTMTDQEVGVCKKITGQFKHHNTILQSVEVNEYSA